MTSDSCRDVQCRVCTQCRVFCSNEKVNYHQHILQCQESSLSVLLCPSKDFRAYKKFFPLPPSGPHPPTTDSEIAENAVESSTWLMRYTLAFAPNCSGSCTSYHWDCEGGLRPKRQLNPQSSSA